MTEFSLSWQEALFLYLAGLAAICVVALVCHGLYEGARWLWRRVRG